MSTDHDEETTTAAIEELARSTDLHSDHQGLLTVWVDPGDTATTLYHDWEALAALHEHVVVEILFDRGPLGVGDGTAERAELVRTAGTGERRWWLESATRRLNDRVTDLLEEQHTLRELIEGTVTAVPALTRNTIGWRW